MKEREERRGEEGEEREERKEEGEESERREAERLRADPFAADERCARVHEGAQICICALHVYSSLSSSSDSPSMQLTPEVRPTGPELTERRIG